MEYLSNRCEQTLKKQETLHGLLREAAQCMFSLKYAEAILLYEKAVNLISSEDYNLTELDICVIVYTLCKCYYTAIDRYHLKACDKLLPLIVSHGQLFPPLYYGLALIYHDLKRYKLVKNIINQGLIALSTISNKDSFKANWPATQIEIPESNYTYLTSMFKTLQKLNLHKQTITVESNLNEECSDEYYQSDETPYESENNETESSTCDTEHIHLFEDNNFENVAISGIQVIDVSSKDKLPELCSPNDEKILRETTKKTKSVLKVDVPEFVPRSTTFFPLSYSTNVTPPVNLISCGIYEPIISGNRKFPQTIKFETTNTQGQAKDMHAAASTQTLPVEREMKAVKISKDIATQTLTIVEFKENAILQEKIRDLEAELLTYRQQTMEQQQNQCDVLQQTTLNSMKSEVHSNCLKAKVQNLETENENLAETLQRTHAALLAQCMVYLNVQQVRISNYLDKCVKMIEDLSGTLSFLSLNSIPTIAVCQRSISEWKLELQKAQQCLQHYKEFYHQVTTDVAIGNYAVLEGFFDFGIHFNEPRSILHDNFVAAVSTLFHSNAVCFNENRHFKEQHFQWWNYGRFQQGPAVPALTAPHMYPGIKFNVPNVRTSSVPVVSTPRTRDVITASTHDANAIKQETPTIDDTHIICEENGKHDADTELSSSVPRELSATSNDTNQTESVSTPEKTFTIQPYKITSTTKVTQKSVLFEIKTPPTASNVATKFAAPLKLTEATDDYSSSEGSIKTSSSTQSKSIQELEKTGTNSEPHEVNDFKDFGKNVAGFSETSLTTLTPVTCLSPEHEPKSLGLPNMYRQSNSFLTEFTKPLSPRDRLNIYGRNQTVETLATFPISTYTSSAAGSPANSTVNSSTLDTPLCNSYTSEHQHSSSKTSKNDDNSKVSTEDKSKPHVTITAHNPKPVNSSQVSANTSSSNSNLQIGDGSNVTARTIGGPQFANLFVYIKQNLPERSDKEILRALNKVREKQVKLTGMGKTKIFAAVQAELNKDMGIDSGHSDPSASSTVNSPTQVRSSDQYDCIVCLDMFGESPTTALQCGHSFHKHCLTRWMEASNCCPLCKMWIV